MAFETGGILRVLLVGIPYRPPLPMLHVAGGVQRGSFYSEMKQMGSVNQSTKVCFAFHQ